jgi:hypothetical protein
MDATGSTADEKPWYVSETGGYSAPATSSVPTAASTASLYLVGSAAQADEVRQGIDSLVAPGWSPDTTVLTVTPEADSDAVALLLSTENEARRTQGLPPVQLVDLRSAAPAAVPTTVQSVDGGAMGGPVMKVDEPPAVRSVMGGTTGVPIIQADDSVVEPAAPADSHLLISADQGHAGTLGAAAMPGMAPAVSGLSASADVPLGASVTVYLVGTQADADAIRNGPPALGRSVLVGGDAADDAQAQETIARQNSLRALVGLDPLTVVDLRTPDAAAVPPQSPPSCPAPGIGLVNC